MGDRKDSRLLSNESLTTRENEILKSTVETPVKELVRSEKAIKVNNLEPFFVNATGREMESFGEGIVEASLQLGNLVDWNFSQEIDECWSTQEVFSYACGVGKAIIKKYPNCIVFCQSDFGFTIALASYLVAHGVRAVYCAIETISKSDMDSGATKKFSRFIDFKFPKIGRGVRFRQYSPDDVLLNLSSHPKKHWTSEKMFSGYGFDRTVNAFNRSWFDFNDIESSYEDFEAFGYYVANNYPVASEAVIMGEYSYLSAVVPQLLEAGIRPMYPVFITVWDEYDIPHKEFYKYREYRLYRDFT